jgi:hypothetical protein
LLLDLAQGKFYGFGAVIGNGHAVSSSAFTGLSLHPHGRREKERAGMHFVRIVAVWDIQRQEKSEEKAILC